MDASPFGHSDVPPESLGQRPPPQAEWAAATAAAERTLSDGYLELARAGSDVDLDFEAQLVEHFRETEGGTRLYQWFCQDLIESSRPTVVAWLRTGIFFERSRKRNRNVGDHMPLSFIADFELLANDIMTAGHQLFFDVGIIGRRWSKSKGATLKTYYLNACVWKFPEVFRQWRRDEVSRRALHLSEDLEEAVAVTSAKDAGYSITHTAVIRSIFKRYPDRDKVIFWWTALGYKPSEISEMTGYMVRAIDGALYRVRKLKERGEGL
ncbi:MAG TPA: hypothetical protein VFV66_17590 [Nonomuraea sp.]|nr:hypothetical protein [Nonomuraea sp.]